MDVAVDEYELPEVMFTYHFVDAGRPVSEKVTEYVTRLNVIDAEYAAPLIVNDPDEGDGSYNLSPVAME